MGQETRDRTMQQEHCSKIGWESSINKQKLGSTPRAQNSFANWLSTQLKLMGNLKVDRIHIFKSSSCDWMNNLAIDKTCDKIKKFPLCKYVTSLVKGLSEDILPTKWYWFLLEQRSINIYSFVNNGHMSKWRNWFQYWFEVRWSLIKTSNIAWGKM